MLLREVVVEGFKSYGEKVVLGPLDAEFNAITGLNGSGKSNLLDAVCFVMGMRSLAQMRASKQDELVYKRGQAGIRTATVTLEFDNSNTKTSPPAYTHCKTLTVTRQVILGGRDRHLVNGKALSQGELRTLFHSVQLNILNPHFLVQQGSIGKVVKMRPGDIRSMLEEAAGTKMYDVKRAESIHKIDRKERELQEVESVLQEEITPGLNALKEERQAYVAWTQNTTRLDQLRRIHSFLSFKATAKTKKTLEANLKLVSGSIQSNQVKIEGLKKDSTTLAKRIDKQLESGPDEKTTRLRKQISEAQKETAQAQHHCDANTETLEEERTSRQKIQRRRDRCIAEREKVEEGNRTKLAAVRDKEGAFEAAQDEVRRVEETLETLKTGKGKHNGKSLREQLTSAKEALKSLESDLTVAQHKLSDIDREVATSESSSDSCIQKKTAELEKVDSLIAEISDRLEDFSVNPKQVAELQSGLEGWRSKMDALQTQLEDGLQGRGKGRALIRDAFEVIKSLDDPGIIGPAFSVFNLKECAEPYSMALEEAGKGKLSFLVVESDEVAVRIFEKSKSRRVTCIPLNKIQSSRLEEHKLKAARKVALSYLPTDPLAVCTAQELVTPTESRFQPVVDFVFGRSVFCRKADIAMRLFKAPHSLFCVTKEGDIYNPSGSVSGGSVAGMGNLLAEYQMQSALKSQIAALQAQISNGQTCLDGMPLAQYEKSLDQLRRAQHSKLNLEAFLKSVSGASGESRFGALQDKRQSLVDEISGLEKQLAVAQKELSCLEKENAGGSRENTLSSLTKKLPGLKRKLASAEKEMRAVRTNAQGLRNKIGVLNQQTADAESEMTEADTRIDRLLQTQTDCMATVKQRKAQEASMLKEMAKIEETHSEANAGVSALRSELQLKTEALVVFESDIQRASHQYKQLDADLKARKTTEKALLRENPWMDLDKPIDCEGFSVSKAKSELEAVELTQHKMGRRVNKKAHTQLQATEHQYQEVLSKREQVMKDKHSLLEFVQELDQKKQAAIGSCFTAVNANFAAIFRSLLPGAECCLQKVEEEGLEMRVAFGGQWKSGLGELSGGQKSLLALSLILAFSKFKASPLYILDEIDAALDLSHCQNIGNMIHTHFKGSQFLVVSLKDNFFQYANAVFKTNFVDGRSTVQKVS
ncbi:MAG: hypothetical protein KVP17_001222 [Porospora cf. gigantea B]|uniref:uncharacterized protein n=1 Tax=Porospora cf. gigantea B TaxID=2853592 RepID=UPI0035717C3C|nr:MAG: hypothetical protein KVP17_001222 [Porospora cf. gigantea B]